MYLTLSNSKAITDQTVKCEIELYSQTCPEAISIDFGDGQQDVYNAGSCSF